MSDTQPVTTRVVTLLYDRDLSQADIDKLRQQTDALNAMMAPNQAAHHHDVTKLF